MVMVGEIPRLHEALERVRLDEANRIAEALMLNRVVGVLGEAEVGKTETIGQALGPSTPELGVLRLDLDGAAGEEHLAFLLAKQIASAMLGGPSLSTLKVGALVPAKIEAARVELAELLGVEGVEEAIRDWPSGRYPMSRAISGLEGLAEQRPVTLWIDHLEAPALTPRHPLDLDRLLWGVRELVQRKPAISVVLSGHDGIGGRVLGPRAAFHQQGEWLKLDYPPLSAWKQIAQDLRLGELNVAALHQLTGGHPPTMLLCLLTALGPDEDHDVHSILWNLVAADAGLAARAVQHARSLHRLGGQVMTQVAHGERPYGSDQRGASPPQEIHKVLERLRLAGLLRHGQGWSVLNPLVGMALTGQVARITASNPESEFESNE